MRKAGPAMRRPGRGFFLAGLFAAVLIGSAISGSPAASAGQTISDDWNCSQIYNWTAPSGSNFYYYASTIEIRSTNATTGAACGNRTYAGIQGAFGGEVHGAYSSSGVSINTATTCGQTYKSDLDWDQNGVASAAYTGKLYHPKSWHRSSQDTGSTYATFVRGSCANLWY